jgi:hypothetical protein
MRREARVLPWVDGITGAPLPIRHGNVEGEHPRSVMNALLLSIPVLVSTLIIQATATIAVVRAVEVLVRRGLAGRRFWLDVAIMTAVLIVALASILVQVAVWAASFLVCGEFGDFPTAFYHSAVNFTTLGYGDLVMSREWRLLGPLEAANGVLMFGISASGLFAVTSRLIAIRLALDEPGTPQP